MGRMRLGRGEGAYANAHHTDSEGRESGRYDMQRDSVCCSCPGHMLTIVSCEAGCRS